MCHRRTVQGKLLGLFCKSVGSHASERTVPCLALGITHVDWVWLLAFHVRLAWLLQRAAYTHLRAWRAVQDSDILGCVVMVFCLCFCGLCVLCLHPLGCATTMPPCMCALITPSSPACVCLCVSMAWMLVLWYMKDVGERACLRGPCACLFVCLLPRCVRAATLHVPFVLFVWVTACVVVGDCENWSQHCDQHGGRQPGQDQLQIRQAEAHKEQSQYLNDVESKTAPHCCKNKTVSTLPTSQPSAVLSLAVYLSASGHLSIGWLTHLSIY